MTKKMPFDDSRILSSQIDRNFWKKVADNKRNRDYRLAVVGNVSPAMIRNDHRYSIFHSTRRKRNEKGKRSKDKPPCAHRVPWATLRSCRRSNPRNLVATLYPAIHMYAHTYVSEPRETLSIAKLRIASYIQHAAVCFYRNCIFQSRLTIGFAWGSWKNSHTS